MSVKSRMLVFEGSLAVYVRAVFLHADVHSVSSDSVH